MPREIAILAKGFELDAFRHAAGQLGLEPIAVSPEPAAGAGVVRNSLTVVSSPHPVRNAVMKQLLANNNVVVATLPIASGMEAEQALLASAETGGAALIALPVFRFAQDIMLAHGILSGGGLGFLRRYTLCLTLPDLSSGEQGAMSCPAATSILNEEGTKALDLTRYLFGAPTLVEAAPVASYPHTAGKEVLLSLQHAGGLRGEVHLSASGAAAKPFVLSVQGEEGRIDVGWLGSYYRSKGAAPSRFGEGLQLQQVYTSALAQALACVDGAGPKPLEFRDHQQLLAWNRAASQSLLAGRAMRAPGAAEGIAAA